MNKQGQVNLGLGLLLSVAITIIVGAVLLSGAATYVGQTTQTAIVNNTVITAPLAGATIDLPGQELITEVYVTNGSLDTITTGNYTIDEGVSTSTSLKTVRFTTDDAEIAGQTLNVTYIAGADGYIDDAGGRAIASLILIFMALVIGVVALTPVLQSKILDMTGI